MNKKPDSHEVSTGKQLVSFSMLLSVFVLIAAICVLFGPVVFGSKDQDHQRAISKAQSLAYQISVLDDKSAQKANSEEVAANAQNSGRTPASQAPAERSGTLGLDPWGQAYHYKIRHEGRHKVIDVWSTGENAIQTQVLIPTDTL